MVLVVKVGKGHHVGKHVVCCAGVAQHKILRNDMMQLLRRTSKMYNLNAKNGSSTRGGYMMTRARATYVPDHVSRDVKRDLEYK